MKRYKHLWEQFISMDNLELAAKKAVKSKKSRWQSQVFEHNKQYFLSKLQQDLINDNFNTSQYRIRKIYEPKERLIYILPLYPDHIVHHALINILGPIWLNSFVRDSYACIPGKGLHKASKATMKFIKRNKYVLQCDIRKFYPSINHQIMFDIVKRKIADKKLLNVLHNIIWSCGGETNLPIGNLTSQWMGNVYLNELDHFVKEQLHCRDYIRYCDDFCLFGNDKKILHEYKEKIESFINTKLKLVFSKSMVFPTARGLPFIGYRHFKKFIMLRKYGAKKMRNKILNIAKHNDISDHAMGQLASYRGWAKWCCCHNFLIDICNMANHISVDVGQFIHDKLFKKS